MRLTFVSEDWEDIRSTKQRILDEALTLFSENGYDGTGVDLIAERVGIKGPSLYKHYKGKEEILNALVDAAEERYEEYFGSEKHIGKLPQSREEFIKVTMERISFTMRDPVIRKTRMLLVQEQFRNERISEVTTRHQLDGIQRMFAKIIKGMMDEGIVKNDDPELLAVELTAPAVLQIARSDRQPQYEEECMEYIKSICGIFVRYT